MTKDEALKLALEAFGEIEWSNNSQWQSDRAKVAITAIKEALAQPEPEHTFTYDQVKAHIQAAMISEREACAKVCVDLWDDDYSAYACAIAIKERGQA